MEDDSKSGKNDFKWPPPNEELDALEQLFISDDSGSPPVPRPTTEVASAPRVDEATQLAHRGRVAERRQAARRLVGTVTKVLPWIAAIAIGAMLGERQARINRTGLVTREQSASTGRAATATPVTRFVRGLTTQPPPAAASASPQTSPTRPRESPVPVTTPASASRSRSSREASSATREPTTSNAMSTATAAPGSAATAQPYGIAPAPLLMRAPAPTPIDARPIASEAAPLTPLKAALDAAAPVPSSAALAAPAAPRAPAAPEAPAPTALTATAAAIPRLMTPSDHAAISRTLQLYEAAYEHLDAHAAAAVWPSLDVPALTRAFDGLKAQRLQFDRCDFTVGFGSATAVCSGAAEIVRRVGKPDPLVERRSWTFHLKRASNDPGADWKIESVNTSR